MKDIPDWIPEIIKKDKLDCGTCSKRFVPADLISLMVQQSSKDPNKEYLAMGLFCKDCNEMSVFEIKEMTLVDLAFMILDSEADNSIKKKEDALDEEIRKKGGKLNARQKPSRRRSTSSKITVNDVREAKMVLQRIKSHEEFLALLGMSPSDIEGSRYDPSQDKKDNE
jgi:hypothetical protein